MRMAADYPTWAATAQTIQTKLATDAKASDSRARRTIEPHPSVGGPVDDPARSASVLISGFVLLVKRRFDP